MKNKWHDVIRKRLQKYHKECLDCLYPPVGYGWGCVSRKYKKNTVSLVNKLVRGIPVTAWPVYDDEHDYLDYKVSNGRWRIRLGWEKNRRTADLKYRNDDHTAWLIEKKNQSGVFIDFDIGGS